MSGNQEKPKRWYKNRRILIQWFFVVLVLCVIAGIIVMGTGGQYRHPGQGYYSDSNGLWVAIEDYSSIHNESLPIFNATYTNADCSDCSVINISALLVSNGGFFLEAPDSCHLSANGNDNCGGNASLGCSNESSYIWLVDTNGSVFSYCAGAGCTTNNSGYQDVWP